MVVGFNEQHPIIATILDNEIGQHNLLIHAIISYEDKNDKRIFFLEMQPLISTNFKGDKKYYEEELMKFICDNSNINLPWKIDNEFYRFSSGWEKTLGCTHALLPTILSNENI